MHVLAIYLLLSNYAWMFCEGLYLYCILKMTFVKERRLVVGVCIVGWGKFFLHYASAAQTLSRHS